MSQPLSEYTGTVTVDAPRDLAREHFVGFMSTSVQRPLGGGRRGRHIPYGAGHDHVVQSSDDVNTFHVSGWVFAFGFVDVEYTLKRSGPQRTEVEYRATASALGLREGADPGPLPRKNGAALALERRAMRQWAREFSSYVQQVTALEPSLG